MKTMLPIITPYPSGSLVIPSSSTLSLPSASTSTPISSSIGPSKTQYMSMHRVLRAGDKNNTNIFTFTIPPQLTRGFLQSIHSREFVYAGHPCLIRLDYYTDPLDPQARRGSYSVHYAKQPLGISLMVTGLTSGLTIKLDRAKFTLLNQRHYAANYCYEEKNAIFKLGNSSIKAARWIEAGLLTNENFLFDDFSAVLEVELSGMHTSFEEQLRLPRDSHELTNYGQLESSNFAFAQSDWKVCIDMANGSGKQLPKLRLERSGRVRHWIRIKYKASVEWIDAERSTTIGPTDQLLAPDPTSSNQAHSFGDSSWFGNLTPRSKIVVRIDFMATVCLSRVDLIPIAPQGNRNCARLSDPDSGDWMFTSDILGSQVRIRVGPDLANLANGQPEMLVNEPAMRSTAFTMQLVPYEASISCVKSTRPFYTVYVPLPTNSQIASTSQVGSVGSRMTDSAPAGDPTGLIMQEVVFPLDVEKVCSTEYGYSRPTDNAITLRIEWLQSYLLYHPQHGAYDDLVANQRIQLANDLRQLKLDAYQSTNFGGDKSVSDGQSNRVKARSFNSDEGQALTTPTQRQSFQLVARHSSLASSSGGHKQHDTSAPSIRVQSQINNDSPRSSSLQSANHSTTSSNQSVNSSGTFPPHVVINGSPPSANDCAPISRHGSTSSQSSLSVRSAGGPRRHSTCLDNVYQNPIEQQVLSARSSIGSSGGQVRRRRLPSPPGQQQRRHGNTCFDGGLTTRHLSVVVGGRGHRRRPSSPPLGRQGYSNQQYYHQYDNDSGRLSDR